MNTQLKLLPSQPGPGSKVCESGSPEAFLFDHCYNTMRYCGCLLLYLISLSPLVCPKRRSHIRISESTLLVASTLRTYGALVSDGSTLEPLFTLTVPPSMEPP
jgi:hypothetical protein